MNLQLFDSLNLVENACNTGAYLQNSLKDALGDHPMVGDIRGEGTLAAIEFVKDKQDRVFLIHLKRSAPLTAIKPESLEQNQIMSCYCTRSIHRNPLIVLTKLMLDLVGLAERLLDEAAFPGRVDQRQLFFNRVVAVQEHINLKGFWSSLVDSTLSSPIPLHTYVDTKIVY